MDWKNARETGLQPIVRIFFKETIDSKNYDSLKNAVQ